MHRLPISIACGNYDRVRPIIDGRVEVAGCTSTFVHVEPEEAFLRAFRYGEFDVTEISFSTHMALTARGGSPYVGVPAFLSRVFRHSSVYVRTDRIKAPADLKGKTLGVPEYQMTAAMWARGILEDDYGVKPSEIRWRNGGLEQPGRSERVNLTLPEDVELQTIADGRTLNDMLVKGEIDGIISARAPSSLAAGAPDVGRLFPDYPEVEREYYRRTGLFPIMHMVGVKRETAEKYPWLPGAVYKAFRQAKDICMAEITEINFLMATTPWLPADVERARALMGYDYWRYGVKENMPEIETMMRYSLAQGLSTRKVAVEELFAASTFDYARI